MELTMTTAVVQNHDRTALLHEVERRVLWLSTAIVDHANRVRPNPTRLKVGGHQASSASMATIMTALWFEFLTSADRVSVKPHASPVLHAINYLLGDPDENCMGAVVPEALAAAHRLAKAGTAADVACVTSPGLLFEAVQARAGHGSGGSWIVDAVLPADRAAHWSQCSTATRTRWRSSPGSIACGLAISRVALRSVRRSRAGVRLPRHQR
jgi:hypothetical protein